MSTTQLSPIGVPGKRYSFIPKGFVPGTHSGEFTELSVIGVSGQRHSFLAKTPAVPPIELHEGLFTELSIIALPGRRHSFLAKEYTEPPIDLPFDAELPTKEYGMGSATITIDADKKPRKLIRSKILKEDEELLQIAANIVASGILE